MSGDLQFLNDEGWKPNEGVLPSDYKKITKIYGGSSIKWIGNAADYSWQLDTLIPIQYYYIPPEVTVEDESSKINPKQSHGQANLPLSLFSPLGTAYGSLGKYNGMLKYGLSNFAATPVIASIYVDAIRRHLDKWMAGQECDSADGVPHFAAILANVDIILCARAAGTLVDDRPLMKGYFEEIEKLTPLMKSLKELHKDKNPHHYLLKDA